MKMRTLRSTLLALSLLLLGIGLSAQHSRARELNEILLEAIRNDFARPTVHARNLFHSSIAMYDAWAVFDEQAETFFLGKEYGGYSLPFDGISQPANIRAAQEEAMTYAIYRLMRYRFRLSPGSVLTQLTLDEFMVDHGYDIGNNSMDYSSGSPAALGNYIADGLIQFGLSELCNEVNDYKNLYYEPVNEPLAPHFAGNPNMVDPNRWQPLSLNVFIDQSGHVIPFNTPEFLSPEWGNVTPFSLQDEDVKIYERDEHEFWVYHDPGMPPHIDTSQGAAGWLDGLYEWNAALVAIWSSHLDPADSVMWDISPGAIGNIPDYPATLEEHRDFYDLINGGDPSLGHQTNPHTGQPYEPQMVPRADYARVLAEFWADGPDSETPPGHWYTILNYVSDHPALEKRFNGSGEILDDLEWDVKALLHLGLGGARCRHCSLGY